MESHTEKEGEGRNEEASENAMRWQEKRQRETNARTRGRPAFGAARKIQSRLQRTDGLSRLSRAISLDAELGQSDGSSKEPPIFRCAKRGDLKGFEVALACGPFHVNCCDELGRTPLHLLSRHAHAAPMVELLLDCDADANMQDYRGWTPLHIAAKRGNWAVCSALLKRENEQLEENQFKRLMGAESDDAERGGGRTSSVGHTLRGNADDKEEERGRGEDREEREEREEREKERRRRSRVDVNASNVKGVTPLFFAVRHPPSAVSDTKERERQYLELLRCFRRVGADFLATNTEGSTLLHFAAISNNTVALSFLLREIEMEVDVTDHRNHTALIAAISGRATEAIDLLLTFGASVSHVTIRARTAYDLARVAGLVTPRMREAKECAGMKKLPSWLDKAASGPRASKRTSAALKDRFLAESFHELVDVADSFSECVSKSSAGPSKRHVTKEMAAKISRTLRRMVLAQYGEEVTSEDICWGHIFHKRLLQDTAVWSTARIVQLTSLFQAYVEKQSAKSHAEDHFCQGFLQYLLTHQQDPDNSLLGLQPEPTLVARSGVDLIALYEALEIVADELFDDDLKPTEEVEGDYCGGFPCLQEMPSFGNVIARLEYATETEEIVRVSKALGCIVRHTALMKKIWEERQNKLKVGDLLITLTKTGSRLTYAYMRYSGRRLGKYNLQVYTIPEELMTFNAHITMVLPLSKSLRAMLGDLQSMVKMVDDPVDRFCRKILSLMRNKHTQVLQEKGLDMGLLHSAGAMSFKLTDSAGLPRLKEQLEHLMNNFQEEFGPFFSHMREYSDSMHTVYKTRMEYLDSSYFPARSKDLDILHLPVEYITRKRMACFLAQVDTALSRAKDMKKGIAEGSEKRQITDWWLSLIKRRCGEFLKSLGYVENAVPQRYIDVPPKSLEDVKKNLSLLQEVLDAQDTLGRQALVQELCERIYPKIDEFIASAEFTVADLLGVTQDKFSLNFCNLMYNANSAGLGANVGSYISGLMSDLQYLNEIKFYEEHPEDRKKDPNIVPISSLVLNYFCRALNEHKTVIELWGTKRADPVRDALESIGSLDPTVQRLIRSTSKLLPKSRASALEEERDSPLLPTRRPTVFGTGGRPAPTIAGGSNALEDDLSLLLGEAEEEYYAALGMNDVGHSVQEISFPITVSFEEERLVVETLPSPPDGSDSLCEEVPVEDAKNTTAEELDTTAGMEERESPALEVQSSLVNGEEEEESAGKEEEDGDREEPTKETESSRPPVSGSDSPTSDEGERESDDVSSENVTEVTTDATVDEESADEHIDDVESSEASTSCASQAAPARVPARTSLSRAGTTSGPQRSKWRLAARPLSDAASSQEIKQPQRTEAKIGSWKAAKAKKG